MKSLHSKISKPIILIVIIVPIVIFLLFNLSARFYINKQTQNELRNVVANVKSLSTQLLESNSSNELSIDNLNRFQILRSALQISKYSMNTEMVIINKQNRVVFPQSFEDTFLNQTMIDKALEKATIEDEIIRFYSNSNAYMFIYEKAETAVFDYKILFIASTASSDALIRTMNLFLFLTLIISTICTILIVLSISDKIAKPIVRVANATRQLGNSNFIQLSEKTDCVEINDLVIGINEMSKKLKQSDDTHRDFLQNASHELRTPLMSIQGYAEGIINDVFLDTKKAANIIATESKRLNELVEELLTLSRIENGKYIDKFDLINITNSMKDYIQRAEGYSLLSNKHIELISPNEPIYVFGDDDLLFRAFYNILTNAIKYAHSQVTVSLSNDSNFASIRIQDDGIGILETDLPHIFDRFYKGRNGNFGLGLAIAKASIELMKGKIHVTNKSGACFEIILPLYKIV